jgi:hypothetical protein
VTLGAVSEVVVAHRDRLRKNCPLVEHLINRAGSVLTSEDLSCDGRRRALRRLMAIPTSPPSTTAAARIVTRKIRVHPSEAQKELEAVRGRAQVPVERGQGIRDAQAALCHAERVDRRGARRRVRSVRSRRPICSARSPGAESTRACKARFGFVFKCAAVTARGACTPEPHRGSRVCKKHKDAHLAGVPAAVHLPRAKPSVTRRGRSRTPSRHKGARTCARGTPRRRRLACGTGRSRKLPLVAPDSPWQQHTGQRPEARV